jgi:hypothetical protein
MTLLTNSLEFFWNFLVLVGGLTLIITALFMVVIWVTDIVGELIENHRSRKREEKDTEKLTLEEKARLQRLNHWRKMRHESKDERGDGPDHES